MTNTPILKFITTKAFIYLCSGLIFLIAINDKRVGKHLIYYVVTFVIVLFYYKTISPFIEEKLCLDKVKRLVLIHDTALSIQRARLINRDIYGNESDEAWRKEIEKFLENTIIRKQLTAREKEILEYLRPYQKVVAFVEKVAKAKHEYFVENIQYSDELSGREYEQLCKSILVNCGWLVEITKASGDQGVDLIARKHNHIVAIQCKKYTSNIGNSAVQEIIAGRVYYKAHFGVVVSNAPYTKSAKELALVNKVKLLHHNELINDNFFLS